MAPVDDQSAGVIRCEARGFPFDVRGDAELRGVLAELFASLERTGGDAQAVFSITREGEGRHWHIRTDGQLMMGCERTGQALHGLIVYINQRVWMARDDVVSIHAAAVATPHGAIMLPADSGSGKTTLCARLLQRGAAYLSDDSVALDDQGRVLGYPKPLGFKGATRQQFADGGFVDVDDEQEDVWQIPPSRLGAAIVTAADPVAVVIPRFEPGASFRLESISRQAGAAALLRQVQNLPAVGFSEALGAIGRLVAKVPCYAVVYGDAHEAAPRVLDLARPVDNDPAPFQVVPANEPTEGATQPFPATDLITLQFNDGALLVRDGSGEFITVDQAGALIWPLLDGHRTVASISAELANHLGALRSETEAGISDWVYALVERGFLISPASVNPSGGPAKPP